MILVDGTLGRLSAKECGRAYNGYKAELNPDGKKTKERNGRRIIRSGESVLFGEIRNPKADLNPCVFSLPENQTILEYLLEERRGKSRAI